MVKSRYHSLVFICVHTASHSLVDISLLLQLQIVSVSRLYKLDIPVIHFSTLKDLPWASVEPSPCKYRFGPWINQQELGQHVDRSLFNVSDEKREL